MMKDDWFEVSLATTATFDSDGRVVSTGTILDPKYAGP